MLGPHEGRWVPGLSLMAPVHPSQQDSNLHVAGYDNVSLKKDLTVHLWPPWPVLTVEWSWSVAVSGPCPGSPSQQMFP